MSSVTVDVLKNILKKIVRVEQDDVVPVPGLGAHTPNSDRSLNTTRS